MSRSGSALESESTASTLDSNHVESDSLDTIGLLAETVKPYGSYSAASVAACTWVDNGNVAGKPQVDLKALVLYESKLGPAKGRIVGLGIQKSSSVIKELVRIDMDNRGKGVHFNAKYRKNASSKLAAVITPTVGLTPGDREILHFQSLKGMENRNADIIWKWWSTGNAP